MFNVLPPVGLYQPNISILSQSILVVCTAVLSLPSKLVGGGRIGLICHS